MERKVGLITGSGTGIGKAIAVGLADLGVNIVVNYSRSEEDAIATSAEIKQRGVDCLVVKADVAKDNEVREMLDKTVEHFGRLDYLVNCAGVTTYVDFDDLEGMKEEYWDKIFSVNVKGLFFVCRAAMPTLKKFKGSIVNITSVAGITGMGSSIAYAASKAAANSITRSLARSIAPEVRINNVAPGVAITRWTAGQEEHIKRLGEGTPMGRVCEPSDVAEVVIPILTSASMVTGQTIVVDGGRVI